MELANLIDVSTAIFMFISNKLERDFQISKHNLISQREN